MDAKQVFISKIHNITESSRMDEENHFLVTSLTVMGFCGMVGKRKEDLLQYKV